MTKNTITEEVAKSFVNAEETEESAKLFLRLRSLQEDIEKIKSIKKYSLAVEFDSGIHIKISSNSTI